MHYSINKLLDTYSYDEGQDTTSYDAVFFTHRDQDKEVLERVLGTLGYEQREGISDILGRLDVGARGRHPFLFLTGVRKIVDGQNYEKGLTEFRRIVLDGYREETLYLRILGSLEFSTGETDLALALVYAREANNAGDDAEKKEQKRRLSLASQRRFGMSSFDGLGFSVLLNLEKLVVSGEDTPQEKGRKLSILSGWYPNLTFCFLRPGEGEGIPLKTMSDATDTLRAIWPARAGEEVAPALKTSAHGFLQGIVLSLTKKVASVGYGGGESKMRDWMPETVGVLAPILEALEEAGLQQTFLDGFIEKIEEDRYFRREAIKLGIDTLRKLGKRDVEVRFWQAAVADSSHPGPYLLGKAAVALEELGQEALAIQVWGRITEVSDVAYLPFITDLLVSNNKKALAIQAWENFVQAERRHYGTSGEFQKALESLKKLGGSPALEQQVWEGYLESYHAERDDLFKAAKYLQEQGKRALAIQVWKRLVDDYRYSSAESLREAAVALEALGELQSSIQAWSGYIRTEEGVSFAKIAEATAPLVRLGDLEGDDWSVLNQAWGRYEYADDLSPDNMDEAVAALERAGKKDVAIESLKEIVQRQRSADPLAVAAREQLGKLGVVVE